MLLEISNDPNPADHTGLPRLIAALSCSRPQLGSLGRLDVVEILKLLLDFKPDPNQRGINDYTLLHMDVGEHKLRTVELLLQVDAPPRAFLPTRIDDWEAPSEMADKAGLRETAELLAVHRRHIWESDSTSLL